MKKQHILGGLLAAVTLVMATSCMTEDASPIDAATKRDYLQSKFSIGEDIQVYFSSGNLYYDSSKFKFEQNQYSTADSYDSTHVSHFQWAARSNYLSEDVAAAVSTAEDEIYGKLMDVFFTNATSTSPRADLSVAGETGQWRILSDSEWSYLLNERNVNGGTGEGKSYQKTTLTTFTGAKVSGLIIVPDGYSGALSGTTTWTDWQTMESAGCVFLPATGFREGSDVKSGEGQYWASTPDEQTRAYSLKFGGDGVNVACDESRSNGYSIRLVCNVCNDIVKESKEWKFLYRGHITEICWEEDYDATLYYQDTEFENVRYCMIQNAWNDINKDPIEPTADYYFYWNTKTNNIYVPHQSIGIARSSGDIYIGDAAAFYNVYQSWGMTLPSTEYFDWEPAWIAANGFSQAHYDGNGTFYLADWLYFCNGGVPTGRGFQFGGEPDYFIADGFVIKEDYNDSKHIGASSPAYKGNVSSECLSEDNGVTPYAFKSKLRYDEPSSAEAATTTYYLADYFGQDHCLAFTAPVPGKLSTGSLISDVSTEQPTGIEYSGDELYVSVVRGSVTLQEGDPAYPVFSIVLKPYCKNADGKKTTEFANVTETFTATDILKDAYQLDDLVGAYYDDYLGTWNMTASFESASGVAEKSYNIQILEKEENVSYKIVNLSSYISAFKDTLTASYYSEYGLIILQPQLLDAKYSGYDVYFALQDPDSGLYYDASNVMIYGGVCNDGNLAFVNVYTGYNICGFFYYVIVSGQSSGLVGLYNVYGSRAGAPSSRKFITNKKKESATLDTKPERKPLSVKMTKVSDNVKPVRTFSLQPIEKSSARTEITVPKAYVAR